MWARPVGTHHVALVVKDLAVVERFYCDVLGLTVLRRWPASDGTSERAVWLDLGGGGFLALEVAPRGVSSHPDSNPDRNAHLNVEEARSGWHLVALGISRDARRDWVRRLHDAGVTVYDRTPHTLYVRDPEGNRVGLSHWPEAATDAVDNV